MSVVSIACQKRGKNKALGNSPFLPKSLIGRLLRIEVPDGFLEIVEFIKRQSMFSQYSTVAYALSEISKVRHVNNSPELCPVQFQVDKENAQESAASVQAKPSVQAGSKR